MNNTQILASIQNLVASLSAEELMQKIAQLLKEERVHFTWVGFYLLQEEDVLVLGPYVGKPTPHTQIPLNAGICGAAASSGETIIVDDVNADPRYLACTLETKSEIVVPLIYNEQVLGEIDIDSDTPAAFTQQDKVLLEAIASLISEKIHRRIMSA